MLGRVILALVVLLLAGSIWAGPILAQCGFVPLKPIPPIGCKDLIPQCVCNSSGQCWWEWICVR